MDKALSTVLLEILLNVSLEDYDKEFYRLQKEKTHE